MMKETIMYSVFSVILGFIVGCIFVFCIIDCKNECAGAEHRGMVQVMDCQADPNCQMFRLGSLAPGEKKTVNITTLQNSGRKNHGNGE